MRNETFVETLKRKFKEYPFFEHYEWMHEIKYIEPLIETIETYGDFLDDIPLDSREQFIEEELLVWVQDYYCINQHDNKHNRTCDSYCPKIDASKKIKQITRILHDFQDLIEEQFGEYLEEMEEYGEDWHIKGEQLDRFRQISSTSKTAKLLQTDIENKNFEWFNHGRFYNRQLTTKKELETILKTARLKYNLSITDLSIKQLKDSIQPFNGDLSSHQ